MSDSNSIAQDGKAVEAVVLDAATSAEVRKTVRRLTGLRHSLASSTEVYMPHVCDYGCKVYARKVGAVVRFTLQHSRAYGCRLPAQPVRLTAGAR